ncbi:MAG TPA: hypothetical protein DC000_01730 [Clostridiales bacterium]|nr:hypothetical protein [Clostridiales bacterium]
MSALSKRNYSYDYDNQQDLEPKIKKRVIKKKKKNKITIGAIKNWLIVIAIFGLGIMIIYNYATITEKKMAITDLEDEIVALNDEIDGYNIYLESLNNTNMIESMAKSYLGMNYPTRKQTVFLNVTYDENSELANNDDESEVSLLQRAFRLFQ